jgi:hypothetical protein
LVDSWFVCGARTRGKRLPCASFAGFICLNGMRDHDVMQAIGSPSREHTLSAFFAPPGAHLRRRQNPNTGMLLRSFDGPADGRLSLAVNSPSVHTVRSTPFRRTH